MQFSLCLVAEEIGRQPTLTSACGSHGLDSDEIQQHTVSGPSRLTVEAQPSSFDAAGCVTTGSEAAVNSSSLTALATSGGTGSSTSSSSRCRSGGSLLTGPSAMMQWASTASEGASGTVTTMSGSALGPATGGWHSDRHVSFVLGSEKAGSFGGYGEVTSSASSSPAYHRSVRLTQMM